MERFFCNPGAGSTGGVTAWRRRTIGSVVSLDPGHQLAHYEILEPIGRGGMGEVYRAKDSKLGRDVAIKVLPDEFAQDEERLRRFQREAKVLASLNHPNIAAIYGLEQSGDTHYLVLELVPGETLADRIARGPIPVEEALEIAKKIAEALEEAHERGIVHRDLKPANVKLTPDDQVKVLDFGLAKAFVEETQEADSSMSPTLTRDATRIGVILGTAAYMSPEQAKGKRVDKRTDIFAFGAVLYEMLTGLRAFPGEDVSEVLAAVIKLEPDWTVVPDDLDPRLFKLLRRCLTKDRYMRFQAAGDVRVEIQEILTEPSPVFSSAEVRRANPVWGVAGLALGALVTTVVAWNLNAPLEPSALVRFSFVLPETQRLSREGRRMVAFSPDGKRFVYTANEQIFVRNIDQNEAVPVRGTRDDSATPFFSPDGEWVGFFADSAIQKVSVRGGSPVKLCDAGQPFGASWGPDDTIVFGQGTGGILRVSANGGEPEIVASMDATKGEMAYGPQILPNGDTLLFSLRTEGSWDEAQVVAQSLQSGERRVLVEGGTDARYVPTGHLVYALGDTIFAAPFELAQVQVTGGSVPVLEDVRRSTGATGAAQFSVSDNGSVVYVTGSSGEYRLVWVDRSGVEVPLPAPSGDYRQPRLSPDGERLAVRNEADIWIHDFERGTSTRLTYTGNNSWPGWMGGERVAFSSSRNGPDNLFSKAADGSGDAVQLMTSGSQSHLDSVASDGRILFFHDHHQTRADDIWFLPLEGDGEPQPFLQTPFVERFAEISPDGGWVAYESNESGQEEVYVRPFPGPGAKVQISRNGGSHPVWARNGRELFFSRGTSIMTVNVATGSEFWAGTPRVFLESTNIFLGGSRHYDVTADGERLIMVQHIVETRAQLNVVLNWFRELERLVPKE